MSPVIILGLPVATTRISASLVWCAKSRVLLLQMVTVAPAWSNSIAIGLPTILEAPTMTARAPRIG